MVVNVPPPQKEIWSKSHEAAVIVIPSLVKNSSHGCSGTISLAFHVTVVDAAYAVRLIPGISPTSIASVTANVSTVARRIFAVLFCLVCSMLKTPCFSFLFLSKKQRYLSDGIKMPYK